MSGDALQSAAGAGPGAPGHSEQDQTPYLDAIVEYAERRPGRFHVPGHKGGHGADPAAIEALGAGGVRPRRPGGDRGHRRRPRLTLSACSAARRRRLGREAQLVSDQRRLTGQPRHLPRASPSGHERRRPAQRPFEHDRRDHPRRAGADLRRARARRRARRRALPYPGGARRGTRPLPGGRRRPHRFPHLLRRGRRRQRAGGGLPRPGAAAGRRRSLGLASAVLAAPAGERLGVRRRPGPVLGSQAARQPDPVRDPPPGPGRDARRGRGGSLRDADRVDQPERAAHRLARRRAALRRGARGGACSPRPWRESSGPGRRSSGYPGWTSSTSGWSAARGSTAGIRCAWRSTSAARAAPAPGSPR